MYARLPSIFLLLSLTLLVTARNPGKWMNGRNCVNWCAHYDTPLSAAMCDQCLVPGWQGKHHPPQICLTCAEACKDVKQMEAKGIWNRIGAPYDRKTEEYKEKASDHDTHQ